MKNTIEEFINRYIDEYEKGEIECLDDIIMTYKGNDPSTLRSLSNEQLKVLNELETDGILPQYLKILQEYYKVYSIANLYQADMAEKLNVAESTIKRYENLQTVASGKLIIKVLNFIFIQKNL